MAMKHRFAHVCLLVRDIEKAIADYRKILGVVDPDQLKEPLVFYEDFGAGEERLKFATFPSEGCEIQFMEPLTPGTPLYERLQKHGEGVHHICFTSTNVEEIVRQLRQEDIRMMNDGKTTVDPEVGWQKWTFIHPKDGHGVLLELANSYVSVNGKWEKDPDVVEE